MSWKEHSELGLRKRREELENMSSCPSVSIFISLLYSFLILFQAPQPSIPLSVMLRSKWPTLAISH